MKINDEYKIETFKQVMIQMKNGKEEFMSKIVTSYNIIFGGFIAIMTAVFGAYWYLFATYFLFNVIDWLTGWYKARIKKEETSKIGIKGVLKKLGYWAIVAVAFLISNTFVNLGSDILKVDLSFLTMIGWLTLAMLMINEARSILENLVECGYNVPTFLIKGLEVAKEVIDKKGE